MKTAHYTDLLPHDHDSYKIARVAAIARCDTIGGGELLPEQRGGFRMTTIYTNSPDVKSVALAAFPNYSGKRFSVEIFRGPMRLDSYWSGGSRDSFAFVRLAADGMNVRSVPENGTPYANDGKVCQLTALPDGVALVRLCEGTYRHVTVFVTSLDLVAALPAAPELTFEQRAALAVTANYKAAYRVENAQRECGLSAEQFAEAKSGLIALGLLNAAGAITDDGRNANGRTQPHHVKREAGTI